MKSETANRDRSVEEGAISPLAKGDSRQPWQRPMLRALSATSAETGVNSTTDANATFS